MSFEPLSFQRLPPAVKALLAVHTAVYLAQWFAWGPVTGALALTPALVVGRLCLWQPFTYIFLHTIGIIGFFFFLIHMYILAMLGADFERRWGPVGFTAYYLACGLAGAAVAMVLGHWAPGMMLGSATVLLGLLAAFAAIAPQAQIVFYFLPMTAIQLVWLVVVLQTLLAVARMVPWVEALAQLAGMGTGFAMVRGRVLDTDWAATLQRWRESRKAESRRVNFVSLEEEVDRILDKVLKEGAGSLSRREQELMQQYSKSKR
jgi:membrane associated rhomboid family serine protease